MVQIKRDPVHEADLADATAQAPALVAAQPDTPLRELINIRWKNPKRNGAFKSKLAIIFDEAFDKRARKLGISIQSEYGRIEGGLTPPQSVRAAGRF